VTGRRYRYAETRQLCQRFAASLRQAGLQPGDTLMIVMPNTAEWPIALLGAMEAGILVSTANPSYTGGKYSNTARSIFGRHNKLLLNELATREKEHSSAVCTLERKYAQIRTLYILFGAFTVLQYATLFVYLWSSLWTGVMTYCMHWVDRSAAVDSQNEILRRY